MLRLSRLFLGKYEEIRRPVNLVDESLVGRIDKARQELRAQGKEVVSVRAVPRPAPKTLPRYARARPVAVATSRVDDPFNRAA
jgi:hypothetical protein